MGRASSATSLLVSPRAEGVPPPPGRLDDPPPDASLLPDGGTGPVLDALGTPAAVVTWDGRLCRANAPWAALLGQAADVVQGRLRFRDRRTDSGFRQAIGRLSGEAGPIRLPVHLADARLPLGLLRLSPVRGRGADRNGTVLLQLQFPADAAPDSRLLLQELFGLTPREAAVAALIAEGHGQAAVAAALGITRETVKAHLKHVFDKTGCHRQGEVAALLARLSLM